MATTGNVYVGIGLCAFELGRNAIARLAFDRALILEPAHVDALVAAALLRTPKELGEVSSSCTLSR